MGKKIDVPELTTKEWCWIAGIFEGEGSFMSPPLSSPNCPVMQIEMTDEDVIASVARLLDGSYSTNKPRKNTHKKSYAWRAKGTRARDMMLKIQPLMGIRRSNEIDAALKGYDSTQNGKKLTAEERHLIYELRYKLKLPLHAISDRTGRNIKTVQKVLKSKNPILVIPCKKWSLLTRTEKTVWFTGIAEGEGYFGMPRKMGSFELTVSMSDKDIIERCCHMFNNANYRVQMYTQEEWKDQYVFRISGREAISITRTIYSQLYSRRQQVIINLFNRLVSLEVPTKRTGGTDKLSYEIAEIIRSRVESRAILAKEYDVTEVTISHILTKKTYAEPVQYSKNALAPIEEQENIKKFLKSQGI